MSFSFHGLRATTTLQRLIADRHADLEAIAEYLDGLELHRRRREVEGLGWAAQRELYAKAEAAEPLTLEHFVPAACAALEPVPHYGRNTLPPVVLHHRRFQKVFCRPADGGERLFGYNNAPAGPWIGPGYFVVRSTEGEPGWCHRGALVIDYGLVPEGPVPPGWPPVVPNSRGLQVLVYHGTRDFMRRVSRHVCVGAAYRDCGPLGMYFVLGREDGD